MAKLMTLPPPEEMEEQLGYSARSLSCGSPITGRLYSDLAPVPDDASRLLTREYLESSRTKPANCHDSLPALPLVCAIVTIAGFPPPYFTDC
jgi:hypothetical protein